MIARCPDREAALYTALRQSFGDSAREGIHLSGLLNPRRDYWQRAVPKLLTNAEIGYFSAGRGHEDALGKLMEKDFEPTEQEVIDGISLRPDFRALTSRIIPEGEHAEFKTRRSNLPANDDEAQTELQVYRDQVRGYMALKRRQQMFIIVLSLVEGKTGDPLSRSEPVFAVYRETMTDDELERERQKLYARRDNLLIALHAQSPRELALELALMPLCYDFMCGKPRKEMLTPPICETCGQVFKTEEFGPEKHTQSQKGQGHKVIPATVKWHYEPRCKWYPECRPFDIDPTRGASG